MTRPAASPRPRVLLVSPLPPPAGGVATWTAQVLQSEAMQRRFDLRVVNTAPGASRGWSAEKVFRYARFLADVPREIRSFRPDLVHVNAAGRLIHLAQDLSYTEFARRSGAATVLHFRGSQMASFLNGRVRTAMVLGGVRRVNRVFVLNAGERSALTAHGVSHVEQVHNFVAARPATQRMRSAVPRLVYVGWMIREKGLFELLDALAMVPDVQLSCVGRFVDLDTKRDFMARTRALGLDGRVAWVGEVDRDAVWDHYANADAFVLPSWTEGFPNTLVEAMICGLPVIATPVGSIPEVIDDGVSGVIVPLRDPSALANAIRNLVFDAERCARIGQAARTRVLANYERDAVLRRIGDLWEQVIAESRR